jgi:ribosome-associated protein
MGNSFIDSNVSEIVKCKDFEYPLNIAMASTWIIGNFKGFNLKILDMRGKSSLADYFVMASTENVIQSQSICDEITSQMKIHGSEIVSVEGRENSEWILIDAGDILVNIFQDASRDIFNLDSLWKEAPIIEIPQSYYFSSNEIDDKTNNDNNTYF